MPLGWWIICPTSHYSLKPGHEHAFTATPGRGEICTYVCMSIRAFAGTDQASQIDTLWLVVWSIFYFSIYIGNNNPRLWYFSEGLKPPASSNVYIQKKLSSSDPQQATFYLTFQLTYYLIAFGEPAGHRDVAPREFDAHSRWKPAREAEEKRRRRRRRRKEDEDKAVKRKRLV